MIWLVGILSSLAGAIIFALLSAAYRSYSSRRGSLAGYFYQVTYIPSKKEYLSIEVARVRHSHRSDKVSGTWWRVHKNPKDNDDSNDSDAYANLSLKWEFEGSLVGSLLVAKYKNTRGGGFAGTFHLTELNSDYLYGWFNSLDALPSEDGTLSKPFVAPMEWRRFEANGQKKQEQAVVSLIRTHSESARSEHLPRAVKRRLNRRLNAFPDERAKVEFLTYGAGVWDPNGPLARHALSTAASDSGLKTPESLEESGPVEAVVGQGSDMTPSGGRDSC